MPSIDSPARGMERRERERESSVPSSLHFLRRIGPFSKTNDQRTLVRGFLECSEHNPLCRGDCVYVCMRFQAEWNAPQRDPLPHLPTYLSPPLFDGRLNNSRITSTTSFLLTLSKGERASSPVPWLSQSTSLFSRFTPWG